MNYTYAYLYIEKAGFRSPEPTVFFEASYRRALTGPPVMRFAAHRHWLAALAAWTA